MQEIIRRCDMPVKKRGDSAPCGDPGEERSFALDSAAYTADLCDRHHKELSDSMAPFIAVGTPSRSGQAIRGALKGKKGAFTTKEVRRWLESQGRDVAPSGRLPNELIEEYKAAHSA